MRRKVFGDRPLNATGSGQTDFSEFETTDGGTWRICAAIDYATEYCLAVTVTPRQAYLDSTPTSHQTGQL